MAPGAKLHERTQGNFAPTTYVSLDDVMCLLTIELWSLVQSVVKVSH